MQTFLSFLWQNFRCHSQSYYPTTTGKPGIPGRNGTDGENGDDGQKGDVGLKGEKGETGDVGDDGMEGEDGDPVSWNFNTNTTAMASSEQHHFLELAYPDISWTGAMLV